MPGKSFHCKKCNRNIPVRGGHLHSIRSHYWKHHPNVMKSGRKR